MKCNFGGMPIFRQTHKKHHSQKLLVPSFTIQGVAVALPNLLRILRVLAPAVFVPKKNLDLLGKGDDITTTNVGIRRILKDQIPQMYGLKPWPPPVVHIRIASKWKSIP